MGFRRRKLKSVDPVVPEYQRMHRWLGHDGALNFCNAIAGEQWEQAEAIFTSHNPNEQAHLISTASNIDVPHRGLDQWFEHDFGSGVAELVQGAVSIVQAWEVRSGASEQDREVIDRFHLTLESAEKHLFSASEKMPDNPVPWQHLLTSGRGLHINRLSMDDRYVNMIQRGELLLGHMSFQQLISRKWSGSHEEMWEHANWILATSSPGSPHHVLVAIAFLEHHINPDVTYDSITELPRLINRREELAEAAHKSYGDVHFDASTPEGAQALSAWFTVHYLLGNWELAADLVPLIGERFSRFPMAYFQDVSWPELQSYVERRLVAVA